MPTLPLTLIALAGLLTAANPTPDPALTIQVGDPAPPITIEEFRNVPAGQEVTLDALKGKVVILEFWGPFCIPCIAAFPHLNDLMETFKDEPVVFLSIADQAYSGCAGVLATHELDAWQGFDHDLSFFDAFGVYAMPRTIIIDKQGNVAAYTKPTLVTEEVINAALEGKPLESHYDPDEFSHPDPDAN